MLKINIYLKCVIICFTFLIVILFTRANTVCGENILPAVIIVYDDGCIQDFTKSFPVHQKVNAPAVSAVNPETIGNRDRMSLDHLRQLHSAGWEVASHGLYHAHLGQLKTTSRPEKGDKSIEVDNAYLIDKRYRYCLHDIEAKKNEKIDIKDIVTDNKKHSIILKNKIKYNYSRKSYIVMHEKSMYKEIVESKYKLLKLGFSGVSFVYPYNGSSRQAQNIVRKHYVFARAGRAEKESFPEAFINIPPIECRKLKGACFEKDLITDKDLETLLVKTAQLRGLLILYGHSGNENFCPQRLKHVLKTAKDLNVNIVTFRDLAAASARICRQSP